MTEIIRYDAIGQKINVGDIIKPFANSTDHLSIGVVTRFNPKSVVWDGGCYLPDNRVVVVTENLIAMGKQDEVDKLRKEYESVMDYGPVKEVKIPIRYLMVKRVSTDQQFVLRFEQNVIEDARQAFRKLTQEQGRCEWARKMRSQWEWTTRHIYNPNTLSLKSLPAKIAKHIKGDMDVVEIPREDWLVNGEAI